MYTTSYMLSWILIEYTYVRLWSDWITSPRQVAENYGKIVSSFADNAVSRVLNNAVFANLDSFNTSVQHTKERM